MTAVPTHFVMPLANSRDAPRFSSDAYGFKAFFEDVEELASRAKLSDKDKITWACRYAGAERSSWEQTPCMAKDQTEEPTWDQFKKEVETCYPHLCGNRRYTIHDLESLISRTKDFREMSREEFGEYYRRFLTYTSYLIENDRLSPRERNRDYLRGFPQPFRRKIVERLSIKKPDVLPDDGYKFADIHEAAQFTFSSNTNELLDDPVVPKSEPVEQGAIMELTQVVSNLTRAVTAIIHPPNQYFAGQPTPGGVPQNTPPQDQRRGCSFCSALDHFIRDCNVCKDYLRAGKVVRNEHGRLEMPDRTQMRSLEGRNIREKIHKYYLSQGSHGQEGPPHELVETHFLEIPDDYIFDPEIDPVLDPVLDSTSDYVPPLAMNYVEDDEDGELEAQRIQAQIDELRQAQTFALEKGKKKMQFDGVEVMKRAGPPKPGSHLPPPPPSIGPTVHAQNPPRAPPVSQPSSNQPVSISPNITGKQGTRAGDRPPQRPQGPMRPVELPPKPTADDPKFRYQAPIETSVKPIDLVDRALDTHFTITTRELLAASADVRRHVKDAVTSKKISANAVEVDEVGAYLVDSPMLDSSHVYLDLHKYDPSSTASPSLPLRVIYPTFAPGVEPECILDGGAQIVVMRKDVWERLRVPITANRSIPMESADAGTTITLGLVENHPVQIGPITVYLQIQVVEIAPFEVLLGRPFFDVTSCSEVSTSGGRHEIRLRDPKNGSSYVFPTQPRARKRKCANPEACNPQAGVNFRL
jgi:hypothetical protein